jgi:hypothetical protein
VGTRKKPQRQWNDKKNVGLFFFFLIFWRGETRLKPPMSRAKSALILFFLRRVHLKNPELFHDGKGYIIPAK